MESDGYRLVSGLTIPPMDAARLTARAVTSGAPIFNYNGATQHNDARRRQCVVPTADAALPGLRRQLQAALGDDWPAGGHATDWVALCSDPGCQVQHRHRDYNDATRGPTAPLGAVVALQSGTKLDVWPGTHRPGTEARGAPTTVSIPPGSALVFSGYLVHRGAAYRTQNSRLHAYIDVPGVPRVPDMTHLC